MVGATKRSSEAWRAEREAAVQAARSAGQILTELAGRVAVQSKGRNDPVTEADHAAQDAIFHFLHRQFPSYGFLGEEETDSGRVEQQSDPRWIVDPLDGTLNYVHGLPFYAVSIGLEVGGELVVGVIYDPVRKECFSAAKGCGAVKNGSSIQVSSRTKVAECLACVGLPADTTADPRPMALMAKMSGQVESLRRLGSAALALAYVAAGRVDAFWASNLQPWDAAAGVVLVREAGGMVTRFDRQPHLLFAPELLASNGLVHEELGRSLAAQLA